MRYAVARYKTCFREIAYRNYVTDGIYAIVNGGHYDLAFTCRFSELFEKKKPQKVDNRSQDEIVDAIWAKITGNGNKGGE